MNQQNNTNSPKSMKELAQLLINQGAIQTQKVYDAFINTDRKDYSKYNPYMNLAQTIEYNAVISQPLLHVTDMEALRDHIFPGARVLDVGCGSGFLCVAFSKMMNDQGLVVGIEHIKELAELSVTNISKSNKELLEKGVIKIFEGDGRLGVKDYAPYNAINVGAVSDQPPAQGRRAGAGGGADRPGRGGEPAVDHRVLRRLHGTDLQAGRLRARRQDPRRLRPPREIGRAHV